MMIDKTLARDDFEKFLMAISSQLNALEQEAAKRQVKLDFSPADFDRLEHLFDLMSEGMSKDDKSGLVVTFARHLGEVVRLNFGGKWHLPLEDEKNVHFNSPVIVGHCPFDGVEFAPVFVMRAYALRKRPGTLQRAVAAQVDFKPIDLSRLVED